MLKSYMNTRYNSKINSQVYRGFTIVELLIVIVVIGILMTISTAVYAGVQQKANDAKLDTAVGQYIKILQIYKAQYGEYPNQNEFQTYCLGELSDYPVVPGVMPEGACISFDGAGIGSVNADLNNKLRRISSGTLPDASYKVADLNDYGTFRGVIYRSYYKELRYYDVYKGEDQKCTHGEKEMHNPPAEFPPKGIILCNIVLED